MRFSQYLSVEFDNGIGSDDQILLMLTEYGVGFLPGQRFDPFLN